MRTLLEARTNVLISFHTERIAAARVTQEDRPGRQLDESIDCLVDVWCRDEARAGAARPRHARRVDRDAPRSHRPQLGLRHGIEVGREYAQTRDASNAVVRPRTFLAFWRFVSRRRESYGAKDARREKVSSFHSL